MREMGRKIVYAQREAHLVHVVVHAQRLGKIVECIERAGLARHHVGVGDDEGAVCTELGGESAQPRCTVAEVAVVVHDMMRGVGEEFDRRLVGARIVAEPDVVLTGVLEPLKQGE